MKRKRQRARRGLKEVKNIRLFIKTNIEARTNGEIAEMEAVESDLAEIEAALKEE